MEIPGQVEWILKKLRAGGFEAYAVGGCVRDALLGRTPEDWDITTSAKPEQVKQLFGRTIDTGLQHGTVTVLRDRVGYEITTYRIDGEYEDGRHPKAVFFTADLKEDLRRRDFTINAMAYSHETGVVDLFDGMGDLKNRVIRCVGDPIERFTEDALRILRAVRFSAQLDFSIETKTYEALAVMAPSLSHVSKERIQAELSKTLLSSHPGQILLVQSLGMDRYLTDSFPAIFQPSQEGERKVFHTEKAPERASMLRADKALRWAAFLSGCGGREAVELLRQLKLDNETINSAETYVKWMTQPFRAEPVFLRRVMSQMSEERFDGLLELKKIYLQEENADEIRRLSRSIRRSGNCIRIKDLKISGKDLIAAGMKPGPELGDILNKLFESVLEQPKRNEREQLLKEASVLAGLCSDHQCL